MGLLFYLSFLFSFHSPGVLFPKKELDDSRDEDEEEDDSSEEDSDDEEPPPKRRYGCVGGLSTLELKMAVIVIVS